MKNLTNIYVTTDIGHASALLCVGYELKGLDKEDPQKIKFILLRKEGLDESINSYWNDALIVSARTFFENLRMLKTRIFQGV